MLLGIVLGDGHPVAGIDGVDVAGDRAVDSDLSFRVATHGLEHVPDLGILTGIPSAIIAQTLRRVDVGRIYAGSD